MDFTEILILAAVLALLVTLANLLIVRAFMRLSDPRRKHDENALREAASRKRNR